MKLIILTIVAGVLGIAGGVIVGSAVNSLIEYKEPTRGITTLQNGTIGGLTVEQADGTSIEQTFNPQGGK